MAKKSAKKKPKGKDGDPGSARATRLGIIRELERVRNSKVICYLTSTRDNMETRMAMDAIRIIYDHVYAAAGKDVDLFLVSNGGDGIVPWRIVTLIREYARRFSVLVPYRAFSAATLTALGADSIVMHPMGMLGPTDPTVTNAFNPKSAKGESLGISVEDVTAYLALVKEDAGIQHEDELVQAFNLLATNVHPLALGNVKRSLSQSRMMAKKLLALHMDAVNDGHKIDEIVDSLTSKLFYHGHPINRIEAKDQLNLTTINNPPANVEKLMWQLYEVYEGEMKSNKPYDPAMEFLESFPNQAVGTSETTTEQELKLAFIESTLRSDFVSVKYRLTGTRQPDGSTQVATIQSRRKWISER